MYKLNKNRQYCALIFLTLLFNIAALTRYHSPWLSAFIVISYVLTLPGLLFLKILKIKLSNFWSGLYFSLSFSIVLLLVLGLTINWGLPLLGTNEPLRLLPLLISLNLMMILLGILSFKYAESEEIALVIPSFVQLSKLLFPIFIVALSILGATSLNNGGTNLFTIIMLLLILSDFIFQFFKKVQISKNLLIFHIFCWSLALLFMTSLRGWSITGHDIQREFYVFQLTKQAFHWSPSLFLSPYNACLSITILPTIFSSLTHISDAYIYKVLFQIIFAFCPIGVYLISESIANRRIALMSVLYFMSFPTFFTDMPMLNRQEVAFVLLAGILLLVRDNKNSYRKKTWLVFVLGVGIVLSHYSTTYSILAIFAAAIALDAILRHKVSQNLISKLYRNFKLPIPRLFKQKSQPRVITLRVIMVIMVLAFVWNGQITKTSRGFLDTAKLAYSSIVGSLKEETKSSDIQGSLIGGSKTDPSHRVAGYVSEQEQIRKNSANKTVYYGNDTYSDYKIDAAKDSPVQATGIGSYIKSKGVDLLSLNYNTRQFFAKLLQVLILIGLIVIFIAKSQNVNFGFELTSITVTSILFVVILTLIPVLSLDYGLLRAFQQSLIILALPIALATLYIFSFFKQRIMIALAVGLLCAFFVTSTGLVGELTGGYISQLHLHNAGTYYDSYYIHEQEETAIQWLNSGNSNGSLVLQGDVSADRYAIARLSTVAKFNTESQIYPGLIQKDAFVYLGYTNTVKHQAYAIYKNEGIIYTYPIEFLDSNKNLLYNDGGARIYR